MAVDYLLEDLMGKLGKSGLGAGVWPGAGTREGRLLRCQASPSPLIRLITLSSLISCANLPQASCHRRQWIICVNI